MRVGPGPWNERRGRGPGLLLVGLIVLAGCRAETPGPATTSGAAPATTVAGGVDPWAMPGHLVPRPPPPVGVGPSFTESAGCAAPQGIRGPYAVRSGFLDDDVPVAGPWGDFFGRDIGEVRGHLVRMELPNGDDPPVPVYVDERAVPALQLVIDGLRREAERGDVYHLDPTAVSSFWPATIPPKRYMSFHAMGIAIDVNSRTNEYREDNVLVTDMPSWFVKVWSDAGWCWGGLWQDIKDAMHFSWKGPRYTPGYQAVAPMPARTAEAGFERAFSFSSALGAPGPGETVVLADVDRDGALDVIHLAATAAGIDVAAAVAIHGFFSCWIAGPTPYPAPAGATTVMADLDGDARPDLVLIGPDSGFVSVVAATHATGFRRHLPVVRTAIPADPAATYLLGDLDGDAVVDLWTATPDRVSVWAGPGFERRLVDLSLTVEGPLRFALGDRTDDGVPDLLVLGTDGLRVFDGANGLTALPGPIATGAAAAEGALQAGDFDGDGRVDLFVVGGDGRVTVYLGGDRSDTGDEGLMSWFLQGGDQPWIAWEACPLDPDRPV